MQVPHIGSYEFHGDIRNLPSTINTLTTTVVYRHIIISLLRQMFDNRDVLYIYIPFLNSNPFYY